MGLNDELTSREDNSDTTENPPNSLICLIVAACLRVKFFYCDLRKSRIEVHENPGFFLVK